MRRSFSHSYSSRVKRSALPSPIPYPHPHRGRGREGNGDRTLLQILEKARTIEIGFLFY